MKRFFHILAALTGALILGIAAGCDKDPINGSIRSEPGGVASIELRLTHNQIRGFAGDLRSEQVTAIARDAQGVAVPEVRLQFAIRSAQPWMGTISTPQAEPITDENGQVQATYSVVIERSVEVVIEAISGQVMGETSLNLIVANEVIGSLTVETANRVLAVPPDKTRQTTITATLVDNEGNALPDMQVRFRTNPSSLGFVDSDTATTDYTGRAVRSFSTIVNKYGVCQVSAQVGDAVGAANIEIRTVAAPANVSLTTTTPVVRSAVGASAEILLDAVVTDADRVGVPNTRIAFEVRPLIDDGTTFGALSAPDTTDQDGKATARFNSLSSFGSQKIRVSVLPAGTDQIRTPGSLNPQRQTDLKSCKNGIQRPAGAAEAEIWAEITIEVRELTLDIGSLTVRAIPNFLSLPPDSNGQAAILAQVRDSNNNGIPDVEVKFNTNLGSLSQATITDQDGIARAVFRNNFEAGVATISASIPGTQHLAATEIIVQQSRQATGSLILTRDREFIYADDGMTTANLTALLSDEDGQALAGKSIIFTKTHGTVNSPVLTDELGIARAVFRDVGMPSLDERGNVVPAVITAKYPALGLEASVQITILPRNPVASLTLQAGAEQVLAGSDNPVPVRATCFNSNGAFAPAGTLVRFETNQGRFTQDAVAVVGAYGVAETGYLASDIIGTATLRASVVNADNSVVHSNSVNIAIISGPPDRVTLSADPTNLITNNPDSYSTITAIVSDSLNNPVGGGVMVRFEATLGNIKPAEVTDAQGRAQVRLTAGVQAGQSEITASVQTPDGHTEGHITVTFIAGSPNRIDLSADPLNIAVAGTGGISTSTIRAVVRDANGNQVETATTVVFELLREPPEPQGCNINNHGQRDEAITASGIALVSLNAGTQSGGRVIRAYTWRDEARTDTVQVTMSNVAVVSGPPSQLDIDLNDNGQNAIGGAWKIEVSARVFDIYRNPVADNIPVSFTVAPNIASVTSGFTGNIGNAGNSEPGLAYASLYYQSSETFSPITITASVATPEGAIAGSKQHILPLQEGQLELHADPANWQFYRIRPDDMCNIRAWVVLKDGHNIIINNAPILFTVNRGRFWWRDPRNQEYHLFYPEQVRVFTGAVNLRQDEQPGQATVYLRGIQDEFFLDPQGVVENAQINACVEGYNDVRADPFILTLTRR